MVISRIFLLSSLFVLFVPQSFAQEAAKKTTNTKPVVLSQQIVAEKVLSQSFKAKEVGYASQLQHYTYVSLLSAYDFTFGFETGSEVSRLQNFTGTANLEDNTTKTSLTLTKPFTTGTVLGLEYTRTNFQSLFNPNATITYSPQVSDLAGFTLTQNLWKNFFGQADRATVKSIEMNDKISSLSRSIDLQNLLLDSIRLFWGAYVSQETFQESVASRDRYQKLVDVVKRKTSLGYANPGELAQVSAELETRIQNVKTESTNFLNITDQLITLLGLPLDSELKFEIPQELPPLPAEAASEKNKTDIKTLRQVKITDLKTSAAEQSLKASDWKTYPDLSLVGKYYQGGLARETSDAYSKMISANYPKYYLGIKMSYSFGSGVQSEDYLNKKIQYQLEQSKQSRQHLELNDALSNSSRKLQSTYAVVQSAAKQKDLREKATLELHKAYNQGRTDISVLIDALNKYFLSEIQYSRAKGEYHIALNEWAALRDQLIPEPNKEN